MKAAPYRIPVYAVCTLICASLSMYFGKETAFDLLHYHFYDGFSAVNDRFSLDYFAAGAQSYFNPYSYVPFYSLVRLGLPALAVSTILASIHSILLWITYEIACSLRRGAAERERFFFGACATTLAFFNPIFLQQLGTSFSDVTTAELVLAGWLLIVQSFAKPSFKIHLGAGILLGCATALKMTNALHAVTAGILIAFAPYATRDRIKGLIVFGSSLAMGFIVISAPWSIRLWQEFHNPMFPLMNGLFKSPEFTTESLKHFRFVPESFWEALARPFEIMSSAGMIQHELSAPDVRYAFLLVTSVIALIAWLWRRRKNVSRDLAPVTDTSNRCLAAIGFGFFIDWVLWLFESGNGRYFIPMACIASILAISLLFTLLQNYRQGRNAIVLTLFAGQTFLLIQSTQYRMSAAPWDAEWFNVDVPKELANTPFLYLSSGIQSNSFIVPYLSKGSGFVNFAGIYALGPDGATASKVRHLIERNRLNIRVILNGPTIYREPASRDPRQSDVDSTLKMFGLRLDMDDCATITVRGLRAQTLRPIEGSLGGPRMISPKLRYTSFLATCRVSSDDSDLSMENAARIHADKMLNLLEDACPSVFQPRRSQSLHDGAAWLRRYPQRDVMAWTIDGKVKFMDIARGIRPVEIGDKAEWSNDQPPRLSCGRLDDSYFVNVVR